MTLQTPIAYTRTRATVTGKCKHDGRVYTAKGKSRDRVASKLKRMIRAKQEDTV